MKMRSFSGAHPFRPQCLVEECVRTTRPHNLERTVATATTRPERGRYGGQRLAGSSPDATLTISGAVTL